ncbi:MAG: O-antigen ligase family protein, partial [Lachnospiraceae bacterium]|nr:O-antigen ligase family protein [Lachnospiraceae bacterium]
IFIFVIFVDARKRITRVTLIAVSIPFAFNFLQRVMSWLSIYFTKSRTISLFAEGKFFYAASRDKYYSFVLEQIRNAPTKIRGIYSDRIYLGEYFQRTDPAEIFGSYSHNFFLEILFQFGMWGILLLIGYGIAVIYTIRKVKKDGSISMKTMYIVFASYAMGQLLISGSYLTSMSFGIFTGLLFSICLNRSHNFIHKS